MPDFAGINWTEPHGDAAAPLHPARAQLLLYLDGELKDSEGDQLKLHLDACWKCRAHLAEIEAVITDFSRFDDAVLVHCLPPPPGNWQGFAGRLRQLAATNGAPSWRSRWRNWWTQMLAVFRQFRWATALLVGGGLLTVSFFWLSRGTPVSAQELLQRSIQAENARWQQVAEPILYRKLRVQRQTTRATESVIWESWREIKGTRFRQRVADQQGLRFLRANDRSMPPLLRELEQLLQHNQLDAQRPLSAAALAEWRQSVRPVAETVSESAERLTLTMRTPEPYAPETVREASLHVRKGDWHTVALQLQVQGEGEVHFYELSEAAYEVMPFEALTVFAELTPAPVATASLTPITTPTHAVATASPASAPTSMPPAALQEAEIAALYALHQAQADLGEQLEVVRAADNQIVVRGLVQTAARKEELLQLLRRLPLVSSQILTLDEALQQAQRNPAAPVSQDTVSVTSEPAVSSTPAPVAVNAFQQRLVEQFGGRKGLSEIEREAVNRRVTEFYNQVEAEASGALAEAWALRRLQERFAAPAVADLNAASRQRLEEIRSNHTARLRQRVHSLEAQLRPQLIVLIDNVPPVSASTATTRDAKIQAVFRAAEQISRLTDQLIAGQTTTSLPQTARALLTEFARLDAALSDLGK